METLSGISRNLYGQPWSCWATNQEMESEEETPVSQENQPAADVMRLPKEDMTLFGFCPEQDDFYIVICELCGLGIKPMGMHHHMNLRHSQDNEPTKTATPSKTAIKEMETVKPKNKKHISPASIATDYGLGVGPPQKGIQAKYPLLIVGNNFNDLPSIRPTSNSKVAKMAGEKLHKITTGIKYNILHNSVDGNVINKATGPKTSNTKSSRSSRTVHIDGIKPSKGIQKAVPIKSGFRLQIVDTSNRIVFKRNSKSVLSATSELKVRHRRKHRRNRASSKRGIKNKSSRKVVQLPKISTAPSPIIAPCPSLAPSPYVALTPLKSIKWNNVFDATPSQVKASRNLPVNLNHSINPGINVGMIHVTKSEEPVLRVLNIDTNTGNNMLHPEVRAPALACKQITPVINDMKLCQIQGKNLLLPAVLPHAAIRVPDITWSTVHPKPLGVCPLQTRKVGGLITTDRRLDHVWQSMKSALLEQDAYQTTVLCSASSSQPDFHLNHKSSIKTILASLAANNFARNSVCKPANSNLRQMPHIINNEKPSLSSVIDMSSSSVMLLSSSNTKTLANSKSFLPNASKAASVTKQNRTNTTTQPYPGIFLRNGHYILPRNFRISLKRRRAVPLVNNIAKKLKEKTSNEMMGNCRNSQSEHCFPRSVPILQFPIPNGLSEPVNSYIAYPEEGLSQVVPQSEIELDVVNSISMLTSNGENVCESTGRLSKLGQLKKDILSGFHSIKTASRLVDVNNKASCRKAASTTLSNVRLSSSPGAVQVNTSQITYLTAGPVTFQQISPQMIGQIQLQSKPNQTTASIPLKLISPAQTVSLTTSRTMLLQPEKDES